MIQRIQQRPPWQRRLIFFVLVVMVLAIFGLGILLFIFQSASLGDRTQANRLTESVRVNEFALLPDDAAYPAAIAVSPDGSVYTGSYATGEIWQISVDGDVRTIENTKEQIGSVSGLTVDRNGDIYVLDRIDPLQSKGGVIWKVTENADIEMIVSIPLSDDTQSGEFAVLLPDDIEVDSEGNVYISDRGPDRVWRIDSDGSTSVWWQPPNNDDRSLQPTGLAYDASNDAMFITDPATDTIYRVEIDSGQTDIVFQWQEGIQPPGFDGITVTDKGDIFVAALGVNGVAQVIDGQLAYLAGNFRGSSDVAYNPNTNAIYVTNWDQRALLPVDVFGLQLETQPRLPFAIDVIALP